MHLGSLAAPLLRLPTSAQETRLGTSGLWSHRPRIKRKAGLAQMTLSVDTDRFSDPEF